MFLSDRCTKTDMYSINYNHVSYYFMMISLHFLTSGTALHLVVVFPRGGGKKAWSNKLNGATTFLYLYKNLAYLIHSS